MKQNWLHRVFATFFIIVVSFPFLIQSLHALEDHKHQICLAESEYHFHADDVDCPICHFQIKHNYFDFSSGFSLEKPYFFNQKTEKIQEQTHTTALTSNTSRGPPYIII